MEQRLLIVSVHDRSWGRTALGLSIADSLRDAGAEITFIVHETNAPLLDGRGYETHVLAPGLGPLLWFALRELVRDADPDAVILCDYFGTCNMLHRVGIEDLEFFFDWPVISLDLWDVARTGFEIDGVPGRLTPLCLASSAACRTRFLDRTRRLVPVPIAQLTGSTPRFRLADLESLEREPATSPVGSNTVMVLTTTADWQQCNLHSEDCRRLATALPRLLAKRLEALGPRVRWVHVGPQAFDLGGALAGRYEWRGHVSAKTLDELLDECALVLSANASATTTFRAIMAGKPVVLAHNSFAIGAHEQARDVGLPGSAELDRWLESARPVHPFQLWPLGYHAFLAPLIADNPFFGAVTPLEVLCEDAFMATFAGLLFEPAARAASRQAQRSYLAALGALPDAAQAVRTLLYA